MNISLVLLEITESEPLEGLIENNFYEGKPPRIYGDQLISAYIAEYKSMAYTMTEHPDMPPPAVLNWIYTEEIQLNIPFKNLVVVSREREYYLGGAHGMREKQYAVFDIRAFRRLILRDFFKTGPALKSIVEEALRNYAGISQTTPLSEGGFFEDTVPVPENFFITPEGFGFHWDPYEIAPYSMGPIEIRIPFEKLQNLLKRKME
jgi:hypothetical protein